MPLPRSLTQGVLQTILHSDKVTPMHKQIKFIGEGCKSICKDQFESIG